MPPIEVVVTGLGVVSPIGIGREQFWNALLEGQSGVAKIHLFDPSGLPVQIAAEVDDFDPKPYVAKRKSLKIMCRDAQLGVAATVLACREAGISPGQVDPNRFGVVLGADRICSATENSKATYRACMVDGRFDYQRWATAGMDATFPLDFLKVLPNMVASHISIVHDARGPNNTIHQAGVSGLLAVGEAARVIQRGVADVMIAGGASSEMNPFDCVRRCVMGFLSNRQGQPAAAMRPFDAHRDGQVWGEGAGAFILEDRRHAEARGANVIARLLSWAATCEPQCRSAAVPAAQCGLEARAPAPLQGTGLRRVIELALHQAGLEPNRLGHVNAHGLSTIHDDQIEAHALHDLLPAVPVTAPKSYFGNLGAAGGAMEMAVSILALGAGLVPATLNYERPDPDCPLQVIHGQPLRGSASSALSVNFTSIGQAAAVVLAGPN